MSVATSEARNQTYLALRKRILTTIDAESALNMELPVLEANVGRVVEQGVREDKLYLNRAEQLQITREIVDDMVRLGPLQILMDDPAVNDIMVNGPDQIYVERSGKLELTAHRFRDSRHLLNLAQRIASAIGRRIDESSPMVDARLPDGSRVNIISSPLALDGTCISIRKFARQTPILSELAATGSLSPVMAEFLKLCAQARLNILISGGTGAGKTTLLNALSYHISASERIVTIEDAAELKLQQPHVIRLETRPPSLEGQGEITQRDLLKNALRMRPDRILLGEVRGAEAFDMLQAMNTGHDGSLSTLHANSPEDALLRLENMLNMGTVNMQAELIRRQIGSALDLLVQIQRGADGKRRITHISETVLTDDGVICRDLFRYQWQADGNGEYRCLANALTCNEKFVIAGLSESCQQLLQRTNSIAQATPQLHAGPLS